MALGIQFPDAKEPGCRSVDASGPRRYPGHRRTDGGPGGTAGWLLKTAVALGASMIIISGQPGTLVSCAGVPRPRIETLHLE